MTADSTSTSSSTGASTGPDDLAGWINDIVPGSGQDFMYALGIVVSLLTNDPPEYYDIALRDFGLMRGALTLGRLAWAIPRR